MWTWTQLMEVVDRTLDTLTSLQHMACDYGQRHPRGPCDCKFGAPGVDGLGGRGVRVGALHTNEIAFVHPGPVDAEDVRIYRGDERSACPELRTAIVLLRALPALLPWLVQRGKVKRNWQACVCEECVELRAVLKVALEGPANLVNEVMPAKPLYLFHDDPPCDGLIDGMRRRCEKCTVPSASIDMQSLGYRELRSGENPQGKIPRWSRA